MRISPKKNDLKILNSVTDFSITTDYGFGNGYQIGNYKPFLTQGWTDYTLTLTLKGSDVVNIYRELISKREWGNKDIRDQYELGN